MTAQAVPVPAGTGHSVAEALAGKIPFWDRVQSLAYSVIAGQWAVGFWSGLYVLVFQAHYFGKSLKYTWDHLNQLWHFQAVPGIGSWMYANWDIGRHIFLRDAPEAVLAYAVVAMIITWLAGKKYQVSLIRKLAMKVGLAGPPARKIPRIQRIMVWLGMPSIYQEDMGRHPDTSPLQYTFLIPSMLAASLPGEIVMAAIIFGSIAVAHRQGYYSPWLEPTSPWVSPLIGIAGGKAFGHAPAVKAGYDAQRFYLGKRQAINYAADAILAGFHANVISQDQARNQLTGMRRADPSIWYPASYRRLYAWLMAKRLPVRKYGKLSAVSFALFVVLFVVIGAWGVYLRKYGIGHGFWMPW
jgi:hypothetical protein